MEPVLVHQEGAVATVTINRPERRNSLDTAAKRALRDTLAAVADDPAVRAVVVTGAGGHFCVGQDLGDHARALSEEPDLVWNTVVEEYSPVVRSLTEMPKPAIAAVEGNCVGAGLGLALACDLRVMSTGATLSTAFTGIGLTCDTGVSHLLPRTVGDARARELVLLAQPFSAEQAVEWGIVATLVEPGRALETAAELAGRLAAGPTVAYAESKRLLTESWSRDLPASLAAEGAAQTRAGHTDDHAAAVKAFLAKEKPTFTGR